MEDVDTFEYIRWEIRTGINEAFHVCIFHIKASLYLFPDYYQG